MQLRGKGVFTGGTPCLRLRNKEANSFKHLSLTSTECLCIRSSEFAFWLTKVFRQIILCIKEGLKWFPQVKKNGLSGVAEWLRVDL